MLVDYALITAEVRGDSLMPMHDYIVAADKDQTIGSLVRFYNDTDFKFGAALRNKLGLTASVAINEENIYAYYAQSDEFGDNDAVRAGDRIVTDEMLQRALHILRIQILLEKSNPKDSSDIIKRKIVAKFKEKLDDLEEQLEEGKSKLVASNQNPKELEDIKQKLAQLKPARTLLTDGQSHAKLIDFLEARTKLGYAFHDAKDLPIFLNNVEIETLYQSIASALKKQHNTITKEALEYVTTHRKAASVKNTVQELIAVGTDTLAKPYVTETNKAYQKDNEAKPDRKLEELDFAGHTVIHKDLLMSKLLVLRDKHEADFHRFNKIIRKWLLTSGKTPTEQAKLNAKIKVALSKLIIVLRNKGLDQDADAIDLQVFDTANKHVARYAKFKKANEDALSSETPSKIKSAFAGLKEFLKKGLFRDDLPADVKEVINTEQDTKKILDFSEKVAEYPENTSASRKLMNKCYGLARTLNDIAAADKAKSELADAGAVFAVDDDINNLYPRFQLFEYFKCKYEELKERIELPAATANQALPGKLYFNERELIAQRSAHKQELLEQAEELKAQLVTQTRILNNYLASLNQDDNLERVLAVHQQHAKIDRAMSKAEKLLRDIVNLDSLAGQPQFDAAKKIDAELKNVQRLSEEALQVPAELVPTAVPVPNVGQQSPAPGLRRG